MSSRLPAVVIDCGTGYTKMGYAGNAHPSYVIPTQIATPARAAGRPQPGGVEDLDFFIGEEAEDKRRYQESWVVESPIEHGQIKNWDQMERFWQHCIFKYLRCEPEDHIFMLTEPPMNAPKNREFTGEILFETFNVKGCYIAVQAVLALWASFVGQSNHEPTGTVIDSGDGVTHVIPIAHGWVIGSNIKTMDIAGKDITKFVQSLMSDREPTIPVEVRAQTAVAVKETLCYTCPDMVKEYAKYDKDPGKWIKQHHGTDPRTSEKWTCDVGYERFLAPEVFFNPEIVKTSDKQTSYNTPLSRLVYDSINTCPIDTRRPLFKNVVLSGGSSMFKDFSRRLQRDIKKDLELREKRNEELTGQRTSKPIEVNVMKHDFQRFAVWFGGSLTAAIPMENPYCNLLRCRAVLTCLQTFQPPGLTPKGVKTRAIYDEYGPACMRHNVAMGV